MKSEFEKTAKAKLEELEANIKKLKQQAKQTREQMIAEHKDKIDELHQLNAKTREQFDDLLDASEAAWKEMQKGLEKYWSALGNELKAYQGVKKEKGKKKN